LNKLAVVLTMVVVISLISVAIVAYNQLFYQSQKYQEENQLRTSSPIPSQSPYPTLTSTPNPTPTATPTLITYPEGSFGPRGYFRITSPTNQNYNTDKLNLSITGEVINRPLSMSYSIDGQERVAFYAPVTQSNDWDPFLGTIKSTVALLPLSTGTHTITVFGTLSGKYSAQATAYFTIT
jgi:hypothetical protein